MISKCANPACSAPFLYLHSGKLFRFEREAIEDKQPLLGFDSTVRKHSTGVEFYWLCQNCSATLTLIHRKGFGVSPYPLHLLLKDAS